jgi:hypothetical protein
VHDRLQRLGLARAERRDHHLASAREQRQRQREARGRRLGRVALDDHRAIGHLERGALREQARDVAILADAEQDEIGDRRFPERLPDAVGVGRRGRVGVVGALDHRVHARTVRPESVEQQPRARRGARVRIAARHEALVAVQDVRPGPIDRAPREPREQLLGGRPSGDDEGESAARGEGGRGGAFGACGEVLDQSGEFGDDDRGA